MKAVRIQKYLKYESFEESIVTVLENNAFVAVDCRYCSLLDIIESASDSCFRRSRVLRNISRMLDKGSICGLNAPAHDPTEAYYNRARTEC